MPIVSAVRRGVHAAPYSRNQVAVCEDMRRQLRYRADASRRFAEEDTIMELDQTYVWITTRRLRPATRDEFSRAWRPSEFPEGMLRAYECYSPDGNEVVGISIWDSAESRERFRLSEVESNRRQAMAPFLIDERSGFYLGRELKIPER